ncbi:hypothetical protein CCACVL1_24289 [Corchorus capsularis]|uniref:F-box domain-containing protein n=1 Tax=Corchorus capsularis TaxID=210143 RepID=A0A1R3GQB9_COCAP|nr:hypothetical protein CCACVL1_24289 [Corchorus capsularis]
MAGKRRVIKKAKIVACSRSSKTYIPDEVIIFEILSRLSVESLGGIMRRVCNTWADAIGSPQFARTHLQLSNSKPGLFIQDWPKYVPYSHNPTKGARFFEFKDNGQVQITRLNPKKPYPGLILCSYQGLSVFSSPKQRYNNILDRTYNTWDRFLYVANPVMMDVVVQVPNCITSPNYYHTYGNYESVSVICFDKATGLQLKNDPSSFRGFGTIHNYVALVQHDYTALYSELCATYQANPIWQE